MFRTSPLDSTARYSRCPTTTSMNGYLNHNSGKKKYQTEFVTADNRAMSQMTTARRLTWQGFDKIQINEQLPMISSDDKRDRKQTD